MSMYELFKFLHVVAVVVWVGSGIGLVILMRLLRRSGDRRGALSVGRQLETLGKMLFMPASAATLAFGIVMVLISDSVSFSDLFILIGFAAIAVSIILSVVVRLPTGASIGTFVQEGGPDDPRIDNAFSRLMRVNMADQAILIVTIWAMVTKVGA